MGGKGQRGCPWTLACVQWGPELLLRNETHMTERFRSAGRPPDTSNVGAALTTCGLRYGDQRHEGAAGVAQQAGSRAG